MLSSFFHPSSQPLPPDQTSGQDVQAPFVLEQRSLDLQSDGTFTPAAAVLLTPALLESRLLVDLTPTEMQTLLTVLCCVTSSGSFVATADALAQRLHLWPGQMRARLERLMTRSWGGEPLLRSQTTETGLRLFSPSPRLFEVRRILVFPEAARPGVALERPPVLQQDGARVVGGLRQAVVEHSRATYGRPRAEVEAEINRFLGAGRSPATAWPGPPTQDQAQDASKVATEENAEPLTTEEIVKRELGRRLISAGLSSEQARFLVDSFASELIERQLEYLPFRHARSPAGMLVASIEGDYAPPLAMRHALSQAVPTVVVGSEPQDHDTSEGSPVLPESGDVGDRVSSLLGEIPVSDGSEKNVSSGNA